MDYIKVKQGIKSSVIYMINHQCFEKLAMNSNSIKSESVRMHFIKIRESLIKNEQIKILNYDKTIYKNSIN